MESLERARQELLLYTDSNPIIVTFNQESEGFFEYNIVAFIRTIADYTPKYIKSVQLELFLPKRYPIESPRIILVKTALFHPNFTADGIWLSNSVRGIEGISDFLMRLIRVLQFKEIDDKKIANRNAMAWYHKNRNRGLFPTDIVNYNFKPRILIHRVNFHSSI